MKYLTFQFLQVDISRSSFPTDAAQCSVYGDPNFLTFDMESFEFLASVCEYLLVENLAAAANGASISITTEESVVSALTRVNRVIISEGVRV